MYGDPAGNGVATGTKVPVTLAIWSTLIASTTALRMLGSLNGAFLLLNAKFGEPGVVVVVASIPAAFSWLMTLESWVYM